MRKRDLFRSAQGLLVSVVATAIACSTTEPPTSAQSPTIAGTAPSNTAGLAPENMSLPPKTCNGFKRIPSPITKNTVVDDDCLQVGPAEGVKVNPGVSLIIIARKQLRFAPNGKIDGVGEKGLKGDPAKTGEAVWRAEEPNRGEKIACACQDRSCREGWHHCTADGNSDLQGGQGKPGTAAGNIRILAYEVVGAANAHIDVRGGEGGDGGDSGHTHCWEGKNAGLECNSAPAPNRGPGTFGANGGAKYEAGTASAGAQLQALATATLLRPPPAPGPEKPTTRVVDTGASWREALQDALQEGKTYDNVSGQ